RENGAAAKVLPLLAEGCVVSTSGLRQAIAAKAATVCTALRQRMHLAPRHRQWWRWLLRLARPLQGFPALLKRSVENEQAAGAARTSAERRGVATPHAYAARLGIGSMINDGIRLVGLLTRASLARRFSGTRVFISVGILSLAAAPAVASDTAGYQPVETITKTAQEFLEHRIAETDRRVEPRAGKLDPRLKLARCDRPLQGFLRDGEKIGARTIVGVRCSGSSPWKVYVPVDLVEMRPVLVARQALPRGHLLGEADLVLEERDVSRLAGGFVTNGASVAGQRLKRQLVSGSVLSPSMLETQVVVRRGQSVTLVVRNDKLNIRMAGTALMDGTVDQRIRVENTVSRRIVEGFVRSPEYVEVLVR